MAHPMRRLVAILSIGVSSLLLAPLLVGLGLPESSSVTPSPAMATAVRPSGFEGSELTTLAITLGVTCMAALIAVVIGLLIACLLELTDFPASAGWATATLVSFVCPATVWTLMQWYCYGPGGLMERWLGEIWRQAVLSWPGSNYLATTWVLAQIHVPLTMLVIGRGLARWHHGGVESAWMLLSRTRFACWLLGFLRGELATAFGLTFALSATCFAVPHVLQCRLYVIEIYLRAANYLDHLGAIRLALPLVLLTCLAAGLAALGEPTWQLDGRERRVAKRFPLGPWRWPGVIAFSSYLFFTTGLPLMAMVIECRSWSHFVSALFAADLEIANTIRIALAVAVLAGFICFTWLFPVRRIRASGCASLMHVIGLVPLGIPPLLIGIAYLRCASDCVPRDWTWLDSTPLLIVLGLTCRAWPLAIRYAMLGRQHLAPVWDEAADMAALPGFSRWYRIQLPLLFDHGIGAPVIAFILAAGDIELSQLLCAPGQGTLALRLFTFLHFGPTHVAASLAVVLILLCLIPLLLYAILCHRILRLI